MFYFFEIFLTLEHKFEILKAGTPSPNKIIVVHAKEALTTAALVEILSYHFMGDVIAQLAKFDPMKIQNAFKNQPIALNLVEAFVALV